MRKNLMHFTDEQLKYIKDNLSNPSDNPDNLRVWHSVNTKVSIGLLKRANQKHREKETKDAE